LAVVIEMVKVKLTVTVTPEIFKWVDEEVDKGHFADRSHAVQYSLQKVQQLMKKGEIKF
jgi:Arc/MetJ-type ribon-helix-helix transcriptional regulator